MVGLVSFDGCLSSVEVEVSELFDAGRVGYGTLVSMGDVISQMLP